MLQAVLQKQLAHLYREDQSQQCHLPSKNCIFQTQSICLEHYHGTTHAALFVCSGFCDCLQLHCLGNRTLIRLSQRFVVSTKTPHLGFMWDTLG